MALERLGVLGNESDVAIAPPVVGTRQVLSNQGISRRTFSRIPTVLEMPNLIQIQQESFNWFVREGLKELLEEISPITDHHKKMELTFLDHRFDPPWMRMAKGEERDRAMHDQRVVESYCRERDITFAAPLRIWARLVMKETGEIKETGQDGIFLGDFPMMTSDGTFIINGAERVVVSQLVRSPGVYLGQETDPTTGKRVSTAKLIPNRGAWLEFETSNRDIISVKVDRKRKMPVTILLRAIGLTTDEALLDAFADVDTNPRPFLHPHHDRQGSDRRARTRARPAGALPPPAPGDPPSRVDATTLLENLFFNERRYDLARVGRYKLNERLAQEARRSGGAADAGDPHPDRQRTWSRSSAR
jgi:DNA-directed RNA polymerase subunit beta